MQIKFIRKITRLSLMTLFFWTPIRDSHYFSQWSACLNICLPSSEIPFPEFLSLHLKRQTQMTGAIIQGKYRKEEDGKENKKRWRDRGGWGKKGKESFKVLKNIGTSKHSILLHRNCFLLLKSKDKYISCTLGNIRT